MLAITTTLFAGILFIVIVFSGLYIMSGIRGSIVALITAAVILSMYLPFALLQWPGADVFALHVAVYTITIYLLTIITGQRDKKDNKSFKFHWAPVIIVLFFVVVIAVNSVFITVAQQGINGKWAKWFLPEPQSQIVSVHSPFSGVVPEKELEEIYYRQRVQKAYLGWNVRRGWLNVPVAGEKGTFQVVLTDKQQQALSAADIKGIFFIAGQRDKEVRFTMLETALGTYQAQVSFPTEGLWQLDLDIHKGKENYTFRGNTRIQPKS